MDKQMLKKMTVKCTRNTELANAAAFLLVGVDREAIGMGDGSALVRVGEGGKWKMRLLKMVNCGATAEEGVEIIIDDNPYDDDPCDDDPCDDEDKDDFEEQEEAADCRVEYFGHGASVCFHAHANRTNDGLHIKEDFVSVERGDGSREIPIVYWNTGRNPVKVDGIQILPSDCRVSRPGDSMRVRRRKLNREKDECLAAFTRRYSEEQIRAKKEQDQAELDAVTAKIMEWRPEWTEEQARMAARMFLDQEQGRSA